MAAQPAGAIADARTTSTTTTDPSGELPEPLGAANLPDEAYSEYAPPVVESERNGAYQPIPYTPIAGLQSEVLGLEFREGQRPDGEQWLFLWDPVRGTWLPTPAEAKAAARRRAEARAAEAEAELASLRASLARRPD